MSRLLTLTMAMMLSGCALLRVGSDLTGSAIQHAVMTDTVAAQHGVLPPEETREEDDGTAPVDRLIERSRLKLSIRYDATLGPLCQVTAQRTGEVSWRLDSCDTHLRCHTLDREGYQCREEPPAPGQL
jgi:hypothetical protein